MKDNKRDSQVQKQDKHLQWPVIKQKCLKKKKKVNLAKSSGLLITDLKQE